MINICFNPLPIPNVPFFNPLETSVTVWFSDLFQGDQKGTLGRNGLTPTLCKTCISSPILYHYSTPSLCFATEVETR